MYQTHRDSRVRLRSIRRNLSQKASPRNLGPRPRHLELGALGIKLRRVGLVQRQQLVANQVVPRLQRRRDAARPLERLEHDGGAPVLAVEHVAREAHLVNLEPLVALAVARRKRPIARVHPHHDGALRVRPLLPKGRDVLPSLDGRRERRARAPVARHLGIRHVHNGVIVGPLPLDDLRSRLRREALVPWVCLAANLVAGDGTVGRYQGRQER